MFRVIVASALPHGPTGSHICRHVEFARQHVDPLRPHVAQPLDVK
jgi:hypothetical protein